MTEHSQQRDPAYTPASIDFGAAAGSTPAPDAPPAYEIDGRMPPPTKTNAFAVASLIASIIGLFTFLGFIVGVVFGHIALTQIRRTGELGRGAAIAGLVIGYIGFIVAIVVTLVLIVLGGVLWSTGAVVSAS